LGFYYPDAIPSQLSGFLLNERKEHLIMKNFFFQFLLFIMCDHIKEERKRKSDQMRFLSFSNRKPIFLSSLFLILS